MKYLIFSILALGTSLAITNSYSSESESSKKTAATSFLAQKIMQSSSPVKANNDSQEIIPLSKESTLASEVKAVLETSYKKAVVSTRAVVWEG